MLNLLNNNFAFKLKKEGLISSLFFLMALTILLLGDPGILTYPGIVAAVISCILVLSGWYGLAGMIGIIAATISLAGQSLTVICPYCTMAALSFLVAGITAGLLLSLNKRTIFLSIPLIAVLLISVGMYSKSAFMGARPTAYKAPVLVAEALPTQTASKDTTVPELFISVGCPSCKETLAKFIKIDPTGQNWQPVIVPAITLEKGKELLKEYGYTGAVASSSESPSGIVPCLKLPDNTIAKGTIKTGSVFDEYLANKDNRKEIITHYESTEE